MRSFDLAAVGRAVFLILAVASVWVNGLFGFTDRAWRIMGSPPEVYPEYAYLFIGLPMALSALFGAIAWNWIGLQRRNGGRLLAVVLGIGLTGLFVSMLEAANPFLDGPTLSFRGPVGDALGAALFTGGPVMMIIQLGLATWAVAVSGSRRSAASAPSAPR